MLRWGKTEAVTGKIGGVDHISDRLATLNTQSFALLCTWGAL